MYLGLKAFQIVLARRKAQFAGVCNLLDFKLKEAEVILAKNGLLEGIRNNHPTIIENGINLDHFNV